MKLTLRLSTLRLVLRILPNYLNLKIDAKNTS